MLYNHIYLGENVRKVRTEKRLTVKQLADLIGSAESTLRAVETGHRYFSLPRLCKMANQLNISIDELLGEQSDSYALREEKKLIKINFFDDLITYLDDASDKEIQQIMCFLDQQKRDSSLDITEI